MTFKRVVLIVKSLNPFIPCESMIQTVSVGHGGVPIAIGMKVVTKEGEGSEFIVQLLAV